MWWCNNSVITSQHILFQVIWKSTRLLHGSVFWPWREFLGQKRVISESMCSYWLLYDVPLSNRWCRYMLFGCWKKWLALRSKTGLWRDLTSWVTGDTVSGLESSWEGLLYTAANFLVTIPSCRESLVQTEERATTNKIKREPGWKQGGKGAAEMLPYESHATASWIFRPCLPQL